MPRKSGLEVLKWVRSEPAISTLPVIVLTSSLHDADIHRAYLQGANAYLVKPTNPGELLVLVKTIKDFWLTHNRMPEENPGTSWTPVVHALVARAFKKKCCGRSERAPSILYPLPGWRTPFLTNVHQNGQITNGISGPMDDQEILEGF